MTPSRIDLIRTRASAGQPPSREERKTLLERVDMLERAISYALHSPLAIEGPLAARHRLHMAYTGTPCDCAECFTTRGGE